MFNKFLNLVSALVLISACGSHPAGALKQPSQSTTSYSQGSPNVQSPKPIPVADRQTYPWFNYPVTLCGIVSATSEDVTTAEYVLKNGSTEVYLTTSTETDALLLEQMHMLPGIFKYGGADGCVSGLSLPTKQSSRLVFAVVKGGISIASGGFSVSN